MLKFFITIGIVIYPLMIIGKFLNEITVGWSLVLTSIIWIPTAFFIFLSVISIIMFLILYVAKSIGCR